MAGEQQQPQQQPEPPEAPAARPGEAGVGALLKASRLRLGQDLRDIADVLRVRYVYMEAIEDGRYDALPGPTYASGFIRAYAEHLGLDSQEVVRRYKAETTGSRETANLAFPEPIPESGIPGGAVVLVGIVIAVVAYGAWYVNTGNGFLAELVSPLPQRLAHLIEGEGKPPGETATPSDSGKPAAEAAPKSETTAEAKPEAKPEEKPETKPAAKPETTPEPAAAAPPAGEPQPVPAAMPAAAQAETPSAAPSETPPTQTPPIETAAATPAQGPVPDTRETPVATARAPEPSTPVEPSIAPGNVPVDMIPAPRPPAPAAVTAPATSDAPIPPATPPAAAASEPPTTAAATATPTTPASPASGKPTRIVVRAKTNSWIQVRDETANELLVTRLLRSGDSYAVPNRDGLRLATGNAGALEILVDGAAVPAIGDDGAVRRNVLLDAEKLKAGQAVAD